PNLASRVLPLSSASAMIRRMLGSRSSRPCPLISIEPSRYSVIENSGSSRSVTCWMSLPIVGHIQVFGDDESVATAGHQLHPDIHGCGVVEQRPQFHLAVAVLPRPHRRHAVADPAPELALAEAQQPTPHGQLG